MGVKLVLFFVVVLVCLFCFFSRLNNLGPGKYRPNSQFKNYVILTEEGILCCKIPRPFSWSLKCSQEQLVDGEPFQYTEMTEAVKMRLKIAVAV